MTNQELSFVLLALGNKTRRDILSILKKNFPGGTALIFLSKTLDLPLDMISRHVSCLEDSGLVTKEPIPPHVSVKINHEMLNKVIETLKGI